MNSIHNFMNSLRVTDLFLLMLLGIACVTVANISIARTISAGQTGSIDGAMARVSSAIALAEKSTYWIFFAATLISFTIISERNDLLIGLVQNVDLKSVVLPLGITTLKAVALGFAFVCMYSILIIACMILTAFATVHTKNVVDWICFRRQFSRGARANMKNMGRVWKR